ncbi:phenylacetate--CoA ligase family protein [Rhodococcus sp. D2-41]|uniref:CoF synthetase n=1 Tax=Speluncibacter jeojiensis TaxID=2710754 RepID=A0A9X4LY85_9ACTN|nr:hypothetical protein [Rhodococcus sp. D2-41]MDG3010824.1 phenylacetate--CoA ligase family protein [Rhodococcus sp. D2-41]MDG3013796.1 hypothetical protein [Corynebacteriales bacterium D3-21]
MYSIFHPELTQLALRVLREQRAYERGDYQVETVRAFQRERLNVALSRAYADSVFYRRRLGEFMATHPQGCALSDVAQIPFTTKDDLRTAQHDLACGPLDGAWVYYETTGTTGPSTPCPRNEVDSIANNTALILRYGEVLSRHGDRHIIAVMGPTELHSTGDTFEDVFRALGHTVVKMWPRSPLVGPERALGLIADLGVTAVVCTPGVAIELARHVIRAGRDPRTLGLQVIFALGELSTPEMLENIGGIWGAAIYNCMYASQEASILAVVCPDGRQRTVPLNNYYELIDPETDEVIDVPVDNAVTGEMVVTNLYRGHKPLIRYRTGDMVTATAEPSGGWVIEPVGRIRDTVQLGGRSFTAYEVERAVFTHATGCLDYQMALTSDDGEETLDIVVELPYEHDDAQVRGLERQIQAELGVRTVVRRGHTDGIAGTGAMVSWKAARFHDRRGGPVDAERAAAERLSASRKR